MSKCRLKVVWICHFSNKEMQVKLKVHKNINEFAIWIPETIKFFEFNNEIELHIISPHEYIGAYKKIKVRGITYHFFNSGIPIYGRHWPGIFKFDYLTNFYFNKKKIKRIVKKIKPDIIHLHGAENAYYSSSVFQFKNRYPVFVTIQGFISQSQQEKSNKQFVKKVTTEQEILKKFKYFGYRTKTMGEDILLMNPNAKLFWHHYPFPEINFNIQDAKKEFDCVFFARISKDKGIEDLLQAISKINNLNKSINLLVIGPVSNVYKGKLLDLCKELGIENNVYWAGFLPTKNDVYRTAIKAKLSILPTYFEIISGTIIESMFLKIPVVAYDVGSIYEVNNMGTYISLVKKGDINSLAEQILYLLDNDCKRKKMAEDAYLRANEMFNNNEIFPDLLKAYKTIINDFEK